jgi:phage-related minor tail protein
MQVMTIRKRLEEEAAELRTIRDEIEVQMHLAKLDARDVWNDVEKQWVHAESKLKQVGAAGREAAEDITAATQVVLDEIRSGYEKLKGTL